MRKHLLGVMLCLALLVAALSAAQCVPSFRGYTGLVVIPTADTLHEGEYNFGVMTEDTGRFEANDLFANYGPINCLEAGFNSRQLLGANTRETVLNAKYALMTETDSKPGIAFGLSDFTDEIEATGYAVLSKSFATGLNCYDNEILNVRGHIGFGGGRLNGLFCGISGFLGNRIQLSVEWDSRDTNLGFRFTPVKTVRIHAALFDIGGRTDLGLGLSFNKTY